MLFFLRTPAVSMATNPFPSRSNRTSTLSRVVPATSDTIIRSALARLLMNVLLPTFRRPTMASFRLTSVGRSAAAGVHQLEVPALGFEEGGDAVAGDAGRGINDADPPAGQAVEQGRLADVRAADDGDEGYGQGRTPVVRTAAAGPHAPPGARGAR